MKYVVPAVALLLLLAVLAYAYWDERYPSSKWRCIKIGEMVIAGCSPRPPRLPPSDRPDEIAGGVPA
jgi:hypothetical protein